MRNRLNYFLLIQKNNKQIQETMEKPKMFKKKKIKNIKVKNQKKY